MTTRTRPLKTAALGLILAAAVALPLAGCQSHRTDTAPDDGRGLEQGGTIAPAGGMRTGTRNDQTFDRGVGTASPGTAGGASR